MMTVSIPNARATIALATFLVAADVATGLYNVRGIEPSGAFWLVYAIGAAYVFTFWIHADCRRLGVEEPLDLGLFVLIGWPLSYAYHLVKTRGWRGLLTLLVLVSLNVAAYLLSLLTLSILSIAGLVK
jgi:hypothetical protein